MFRLLKRWFARAQPVREDSTWSLVPFCFEVDWFISVDGGPLVPSDSPLVHPRVPNAVFRKTAFQKR